MSWAELRLDQKKVNRGYRGTPKCRDNKKASLAVSMLQNGSKADAQSLMQEPWHIQQPPRGCKIWILGYLRGL